MIWNLNPLNFQKILNLAPIGGVQLEFVNSTSDSIMFRWTVDDSDKLLNYRLLYYESHQDNTLVKYFIQLTFYE